MVSRLFPASEIVSKCQASLE